MKLLPALLALNLLLPIVARADDADPWQGAAVGWFRSVDRAEAVLMGATLRGGIESAERASVLEEFRVSAGSLRAMAASALWADSLLKGSMAPVPPPQRPQGQWGNRFVRMTSIVAVSTSMAGIVAAARDADPETRNRLAQVSGWVGGSGALFNLLRPRPKPPPYVDPSVRAQTAVREMMVRDTYSETATALRDLMAELDAVNGAGMASDSAAVTLARRYTEALVSTSAILDIQVPHAAAIARQGSSYPGFNPDARARLAALADHMELVSRQWRSWRWLTGRSQRSALGFLALVERP
jgi:hypothetical protein